MNRLSTHSEVDWNLEIFSGSGGYVRLTDLPLTQRLRGMYANFPVVVVVILDQSTDLPLTQRLSGTCANFPLVVVVISD